MQNEDSRASQYPDTSQIYEDIECLIYRYYTEVDIHGNHDAYAQCFAEDML